MDKQHWMDVLPSDPYTILTTSTLHTIHRQTLTMLYQPIIGSLAFSLYMTLWGDCEQNQLNPAEHTHHSLMLGMKSNMRTVYEQRLVLEGMGLLKVFEQNNENGKHLIYDLQSPLSPYDFFEEPILNIFLYKTVGKSQYSRLKSFFMRDEIERKGYTEITRSFDSVFKPMTSQQVAEIQRSSQSEDLMTPQDKRILKSSVNTKITVKNEEFDYQLFLDGLSDTFVPKRAFTPEVKETICKLAFLYGINPIQMKSITMRAVTDENRINVEKLRIEAREWYQFEHHDQFPHLVEKVQPMKHRQATKKEPTTQEEQLIQAFETISPRQYLKEIAGGAEPTAADLKIIEEVMFEQKLLPGVVNVLIDYVMIRLDKKLSRNYVMKIASHWARKGVKTVKDAMELARKEYIESQQTVQNAAKTRTGSRRNKPIRTEIVPDWLNRNDDVQSNDRPNQEQNGNQEIDIEEERKRLEQELQMFKRNKKK
ncbi:DnaD domain protein [Bacillus sp. RG28]|uniref:DnaD domain protein n=1 Tax=Gottfriedia endophytica TaxID=2820819 RepID=A0A940NM85_9BACI|nr:DnaD domain protein [Gottfriedia endophytica]MBP0724028.1 DnaD domain protein [Gottfriedia endophytica]